MENIVLNVTVDYANETKNFRFHDMSVANMVAILRYSYKGIIKVTIENLNECNFFDKLEIFDDFSKLLESYLKVFEYTENIEIKEDLQARIHTIEKIVDIWIR